MATFTPIRGSQAEINDTPIVDGQFFIETDQTINNLYIDNNNTRITLGLFDWTMLVKPFSIIGNRLIVENDTLNADNQNWNIISNKPFENIGSGLSVSNNVLNFNSVTWSIINNKPFITINNNTFNITTIDNKNVLNANSQIWANLINKPFETIDSNTFNITTFDDIEVLNANDQIWANLIDKPFETLGVGLAVAENGTLYATGGGLYKKDWYNDVLNKPFETLGNTLSIEVVDNKKQLIIGNITWSNIGIKPFETVGNGLQVVNNELILDTVTWNNIINKPYDDIGAGLNVDSNYVLNLNTQTWNNINNKPFTTIGNGLSVDINDVLFNNLQSVILENVGTPSDTNVSLQELIVNNNTNNPIEIQGSKYMEYTQTLNLDTPTMFIFTNNDNITSNSSIDVMTLLNNSNNTKTTTYRIIPNNVSVNNGQCVVTYPASEIGTVTCRIYIL